MQETESIHNCGYREVRGWLAKSTQGVRLSLSALTEPDGAERLRFTQWRASLRVIRGHAGEVLR